MLGSESDLDPYVCWSGFREAKLRFAFGIGFET